MQRKAFEKISDAKVDEIVGGIRRYAESMAHIGEGDRVVYSSSQVMQLASGLGISPTILLEKLSGIRVQGAAIITEDEYSEGRDLEGRGEKREDDSLLWRSKVSNHCKIHHPDEERGGEDEIEEAVNVSIVDLMPAEEVRDEGEENRDCADFKEGEEDSYDEERFDYDDDFDASLDSI